MNIFDTILTVAISALILWLGIGTGKDLEKIRK